MSKLINCILLLTLITALCCGIAMAEVVDSGTFSGGGEWILDENGVLTISGQACVANQPFDYNMQQKITQIVFGPDVVEIEDSQFSDAEKLTAFIVDPANQNYTSVDGILYNKSMSILIEAPAKKTGSFVIPVTVSKIGYNAFAESHLSEITFPEGLLFIPYGCMFGSESLTTIHFPSSLISIASTAFKHCESLKHIYFNSTCNDWLTNVQIEDENECLQLFTVICTDGEVPPKTITGTCGTNVTYTLTPDGTLTVSGGGEWDHWAFEGNDYIKRVILEPGVTEIGYGGLYWTKNVGEVVIPDSVTKIGYEAVYACQPLTTITIPASVTVIENEAFNGCDNLKTVYFGGTTDAWNSMVSRDYDHYILSKCVVYCSDGVLNAPESASGTCGDGLSWELDTEGVLTISGEGALSYDFDYELRQKIKTVRYGAGISYIEPGLFSYSYDLTTFEVDADNPTYTTVNGILYTKDMTELIECPTNKIGDLIIPEGVISICHDAFIGNHLASIILPNSLETIGYQAFWNSAYLTEITLPPNYTDYDSSSFNRCQNMTAFYVADDNEEYAAIDGILYDKNLTTLIRAPGGMSGSLTIRTGVSQIHEGAFQWCEELTAMILSEGIQTIGANAFSYSGVKSVYLPASLITIERGAFENTDSLNYVHYAGSTEDWTNVTIGDRNASLLLHTIHCQDGEVASQPVTGTIGEGITYMLTAEGDLTVSGAGQWDYWAFNDNTIIVSVVLDPGVTEIGWGGFAWCTNLASIVLPNTVTDLKYEAFYYCRSLESIAIPASVTSFGNEVFDGCQSLTDITFGGTITQWQALVNGTDNSKLDECVIHCSDGDIGGSIPATNYCGDNVTWTLDDEGTLVISGAGAMYDYAIPGNAPPWRWSANEVGYIVIEDGVTHIGSYAFWYCDNFNVIEIPASVTSIGQSAFANCSSMMEVDYSGIRSGWEEISIAETGNEYLFASELVCGIPDEGQISAAFDAASGCLTISGTGRMPQYQLNQNYCATNAPWYDYHDSIRSIVIESGITSISDGAFSNCSHMTEITIPNSVTDIGSYAFFGCSSLTGISIPGGVVSIRTETFAYCTSLTNVTFPDDLLLIENAAFTGCSGLTSIVFPSKLTAIRSQAFYGCSGLTSITLPASLRSIGNVAFTECGLTEINVSGSATTFHFFYADDNGNHLYHINLPSGLTALESTAFYANPLRYDTPDFVLPSDLTAIETEAFSGTDARFVWLPEGITSIGANAFANSQVKYVYIPYGCNSIGAGAFPAGTIILGDFNSEWDAGYARTWAEQNGCIFILLEAPFSGNG